MHELKQVTSSTVIDIAAMSNSASRHGLTGRAAARVRS